MKVQYINPFLQATTGLFKDFLGIQVTAGKPYINDERNNLGDVSAIIGLAGETVGAVVLSFTHDSAIAIISKMAGKKYAALGSEVLDGVGEMVNIIAGNAKKDLDEFRIMISLPGVVTGSDYRIHWPEGIPVVCIPFQSDLGAFNVNVSLRDLV